MLNLKTSINHMNDVVLFSCAWYLPIHYTGVKSKNVPELMLDDIFVIVI